MNRTPGPWEAFGVDVHELAGMHRIARAIAIDYEQSSRGPVPEYDAEANARLIAAAPELYEACERIAARPAEAVEMMRREGFVIDDLDDRWQKLAFTLYSDLVASAQDASAAIAKAKEIEA